MQKTWLDRCPAPIKYGVATLVWVGVWQVAAMRVNEPLLLPSPIQTLLRIIQMAGTSEYWTHISHSFGRILLGIVVCLGVAVLGGLISGLCQPVHILFTPVLSVVRATPVASFIVLLTLWMSRENVVGVISFLTILPIVWTGVEEGIRQTDPQLEEVARMLHLGVWRKLRYLYFPSTFPYMMSSIRSCLGMAWKAGVAAEVIVLPAISIGRQLYYSSNNLDTSGTFAWSVSIVLLSFAVNSVVSLAYRCIEKTQSKFNAGREVAS